MLCEKTFLVLWLLRSCSSMNTQSLAPKTPVRAEPPSALSLPETSDCELAR